MATHSCIAWRISWTEKPVGYSPWGRKESDMTEATQYAWEAGIRTRKNEIKEKGIFPYKKVHYQVGDDDTTGPFGQCIPWRYERKSIH